MAEELVEYENTIDDDDGSRWVARVLGAQRDDGRWVGWIRFRETATDRLLETERETTQPDRDDLVYWAKGLTYFYLDGALARARRRSGRRPEERELPPVEKAVPAPDEVGPRLKVTGASEHAVRELMGSTDPRPGAIHEVPDAGAVVYEGSDEDGGVRYFALRFGSRNTGAVLSNWVWSRLNGTGATVHVDGEPVELTQDALSHAVVGE